LCILVTLSLSFSMTIVSRASTPASRWCAKLFQPPLDAIPRSARAHRASSHHRRPLPHVVIDSIISGKHRNSIAIHPRDTASEVNRFSGDQKKQPSVSPLAFVPARWI
jgi:hypothetical protein